MAAFPGEVHRGVVTRITTEGVFVMVPNLGYGMEFGPVEASGVGYKYKVNDKVLVALVGALEDDVVIIGVLRDADAPAGGGIQSFANAAARDVELTTPTEATFAWLEDVNQLTVYRDGGWVDYASVHAHAQYALLTDPRFTDARTPLAHASTHQPGGSDAMAVDAAANVGSLRTLGTGATQAAAGTHTHGGGGASQADIDDLEILVLMGAY